jgi:hypothetical protein
MVVVVKIKIPVMMNLRTVLFMVIFSLKSHFKNFDEGVRLRNESEIVGEEFMKGRATRARVRWRD